MKNVGMKIILDKHEIEEACRYWLQIKHGLEFENADVRLVIFHALKATTEGHG